MKILAIESSCDETAAAVISDKKGYPYVASSIVASQIDIHKIYGGVVPEVAARAHIENITAVIEQALKKAGISHNEIDRIAVTNGPGLVGSLVVGVETAKALAISWEKPLFPINHLEGHIYANFIREGPNNKNQMPIEVKNQHSKIKNLDFNKNLKFQISNSQPSFPLIALLVSGGHTLLIFMKKHLDYQIIGQTLDDAAGEAFDKGARILGLPYPGGPQIAHLAELGNEKEYDFPLIDLTGPPIRNKQGFLEKSEPSLDFSFSGLKTALFNQVKKSPPKNKKDIANLAASYQKAIVDSLVQNSLRATKKYKPQTFILSGGVAANQMLRSSLKKAIEKQSPSTYFLTPNPYFCTDNAAMIGAAAYFRPEKKSTTSFEPLPNLKLKSFS